MTVKQLIEKLQTVDPNKTVYLGDIELDEDTYFRLVQNVREFTNEGEDLVVLTYRM